MAFLYYDDRDFNALVVRDESGSLADRREFSLDNFCKLALGDTITEIDNLLGDSVGGLLKLDEQVLCHCFRVLDHLNTMALVCGNSGVT